MDGNAVDITQNGNGEENLNVLDETRKDDFQLCSQSHFQVTPFESCPGQ